MLQRLHAGWRQGEDESDVPNAHALDVPWKRLRTLPTEAAYLCVCVCVCVCVQKHGHGHKVSSWGEGYERERKEGGRKGWREREGYIKTHI